MVSRILSTALVLATAVRTAEAQSLGDIAAREAKRRETIEAPARVLTGEDLKASVSPIPDPPGTEPSTASTPVPTQARVALSPATFKGGQLPPVSLQAMGGGEVTLELSVTKDGRVENVTVLRQTPPFTEALVAAVKTWTFTPAEDAAAPAQDSRPDPSTKRPIEAKVLVVGLFRPPSLFPGTHGEVPKTVGRSSEGSAALTGGTTMPMYPPNALFDGVVLAELKVSASGAIERASIVRSAAAFDQPTLDAVKSLSFRPPQVHGRAAASNAYVVAMFRQPITP
jgi:TonB family protein